MATAAVAEAEVAGLFMNTNKPIQIRPALIEMGYPQPPTPLKSNNTTAQRILTGKLRQKKDQNRLTSASDG